MVARAGSIVSSTITEIVKKSRMNVSIRTPKVDIAFVVFAWEPSIVDGNDTVGFDCLGVLVGTERKSLY